MTPTTDPMTSPCPQKNTDSIQSKYSTLNNPEPDFKYPNYVSQANQSQTAEACTSTKNEQPDKK